MASKIFAVFKLIGGIAETEDALELAEAVFEIAHDHSDEILETVQRIEAKIDKQVLSRVQAAQLSLEAYLAGDLSAERRNARIDQAITHLEYVYSFSCESKKLEEAESTAWSAVLLLLCYSFLGSKQLQETWQKRAKTAFERWREITNETAQKYDNEALTITATAYGEMWFGWLPALATLGPVGVILVYADGVRRLVSVNDVSEASDQLKAIEAQLLLDVQELKALG